MKREIIVTDLTRFRNQEYVCTAGIDRLTGECIRPMPYLKTARCKELNVLPGAILTGHFTVSREREGPHQEDHNYVNLACKGRCSASEFKTVLQQGLFKSVEEGFESELSGVQKHIPFGRPVHRSIITISVMPASIAILADSSKPGRIAMDFKDSTGRLYQNISITDLGFYSYAAAHSSRTELAALSRFFVAQAEVLLRLGLSRRYQAPDGRDGYWLQANGVYAYPDYHRHIRSDRAS